MSLDLAQHVEWSSDDDYYYATVELRTPDGQLGTVEVRVDRPWVIQTAQAVRKRLLATAPAGVDIGAWKNPSDPARFVKLCQHIAGEEVKRQLTEQVKRDGIVVAPWFGEWTTATADAAYRLVQAAQAGDDVSVQQLERIRECAEAGDPAAAKALGMINSVAKLVARGLPPPSVVASQVTVEGGALPVRRLTTRTPAPAPRYVAPAPRYIAPPPPPRYVAPPPAPSGVTGPRVSTTPTTTPTPAPSGVMGPRVSTTPTTPTLPTRTAPSGEVAPLSTTVKAPVITVRPMAQSPLAAERPTVTTLVPRPAPIAASPLSPALPMLPAQVAPLPQLPYDPWAQYPYGLPPMMPMMPMMPMGDFGGGGGGYGGDLGPDDFLAFEEDNGAGEEFDDDDGTYYEDEGMTESDFPTEATPYAIGEFPEEIAQSRSEDDDAEMPEGGEDGPFPGEGTVGAQ